MTKRLIAHIGTHKTGSTSIQKALWEARDALRAAGVLFPSTDRGPRPSKHHSVSTAAKGRDAAGADAEYRALMDEFDASGAHTMIISAEGLSAPNAEVPEFFKRFRPDFEIDVVCYLRRQDLFIESLYNQVLRDPQEAETRTIGEFWRDERIRQRLNYHQTLSNWQAIPARIVALDFAREVKAHGLLGSFLRAGGLESLGPLPDKMANKSPDMNLVLTLRELHLHQVEHNHKRLIRAAREIEQAGDLKFLKYTLGSRDRQALLQSYAEVNQALARDFGVRFADDLPDEGAEQVSKPDPRYVLRIVAALSLKSAKDEAEAAPEKALSPAEREQRARARAMRNERRSAKSERREKKAGKPGRTAGEERQGRRAAGQADAAPATSAPRRSPEERQARRAAKAAKDGEGSAG